MIKERYCSYEVARLLKEKGFRENCRYCYGTAVRHNGEDIDEDEEFELKSEGRAGEIKYIKGGILHNLYYGNGGLFGKDVCAAPTHQMAMDWLRIVHKIHIIIIPSHTEDNFFRYKIIHTPDPLDDITSTPEWFNDYEKAVEAACIHALNFLVRQSI